MKRSGLFSSILVFILLLSGCGKPSTVPGPDAAAVSGGVAKPKAAAVTADKLQNRAGVIYVVNGQEPFSGAAQEFYDNGQMLWEAEITKGYVTGLKRWHENGVLELTCGFTQGTLADIETGWKGLLSSRASVLDGEFASYDDEARKQAIATFRRGELVGNLRHFRTDGTEIVAGRLQERLVAALDLVLLEVPAGRFTMGSPLSEEGRAQYEVHHEVNISQPFWLGKTELTQAQWQAVMGKNPAGFTGDLRRPVERVSWDDVMAFCKKLTERERAAGTLPPGYEYTLPTEAQWEYACRAGTTEAFAGELDAMAWYSANSGGSTHPVATKEPNHWGFHDMHGNVLEWCKDEYGDYPTGPVTDPQGASEGSIRVRRSGSWYDAAVNCRSANRGRGGPEARIDALGFRLCLAPVRL